ncbi:MAG: Zinc carboxypeptidase [Chthonomonadales bacterium]|nr:Zinc carboxypeptidase [Chthonomonadales bacterium]
MCRRTGRFTLGPMPALIVACVGLGFAASCAPPLQAPKHTPASLPLHQAEQAGNAASSTQTGKAAFPTTRTDNQEHERTDVYGSSRNGVPLTAYIFGKTPPTTIIFGGFHGDERSPPGVVERLRTYLKAHPEARNGREVILVPLANPDGYQARSRVNAAGVDINRNFPSDWKPKERAARYNPGPFANSEPETRAIIGLLKKYTPSKIISIHQPKDCLNWDGAGGHALANEMQRFSGYKVVGDIGYPTPGSFGKYCDKQLGVGVVTLELPDISVKAAWNDNQTAFVAAIQYIPKAKFLTDRK